MKTKFLPLLILALCVIAGQTQVATGQEFFGDAHLPDIYLDTTYAPNPGGTTYTPSNPTDLQTALDLAQLGDTIELQAGTIYSGNFHLPKKTTGSGWIIIRTSNLSGISAPETRVNPTTQASAMPKLETPIDFPVIRTDAGAHHYRLIGLEIRLASGVTRVTNALVTLGNGDESDANLPSDLIVDRCYVHGLDSAELKRGVQLNGKNSSVIDSYISKCHAPTLESQGVSGWAGPGPFKVVNNYIEASGENLFFGGGEIPVINRVPTNIEIRRNHLFKPLSWRHNKLVKNLFELKNARRVLVDGNLLENNWAWEWNPPDPCLNNNCAPGMRGQNGQAVLFTPRNESSNNATWTVVEDVTFSNNIVRHTTGGIVMSAYDDLKVSQQTKRITITNNLFEDINTSKWGTLSGTTIDGVPLRAMLFFMVGKDDSPGPADVHITHNTGFNSGNLANIIWGGDACTGTQSFPGFMFINNIAPHNSNHAGSQAGGIVGSCRSTGESTLGTFYQGATLTKNVMMGGDSNLYSAHTGNYFPADWAAVRFVNMAGGDYHLASNSPYKGAGTDSKDIGLSDATLLPAATPAPVATLPVRINAGGPQYVDGGGNTWLADDYHLAGNAAAPSNVSTANILNTTDDVLYRSERYGGNSSLANPVSYAIRVPNGSYTVRLHFAEIYWCVSTNPCPNGGTGARVFDVSLEGSQVLNDYDIIATTGGALRARVEEFQTTINDGILNIDAVASVDNAKISAIEVIANSSGSNDVTWTSPAGVTVDGNSLTKIGATGWNAGAISTQTLTSGDGYVEFSTNESNKGKLIGLSYQTGSTLNEGASYQEIEYALHLRNDGNVLVFESGVNLGVKETYAAGNKFRVAIESGAIKYQKSTDGVTFSTFWTNSSPTLQYPIAVDTSLYNTGATITNVRLVPTTTEVWIQGVGVTISGDMLTKIGGTGWNSGAISVKTLTGGDGYVEFSTNEADKGKLIGLSYQTGSTLNEGQSYQEIEFALHLRYDGNVLVFESGVSKGVQSSYVAGDKFRVVVEGSVVKYQKLVNGTFTTFYTNSTPVLQYPMVVDTSLYHNGATITLLALGGSWN